MGSTTRSRVFATYRQITGLPYINHAYVYDGNVVVRSCRHRHGARGRHGAQKAQACADRMLRQYLKDPTCSCTDPAPGTGHALRHCSACGGRLG